MCQDEPDQTLRLGPPPRECSLISPTLRSPLGDSEGWAGELYRRYSRYARSIACRSGLPHEEIDDVVQDTFVVVYRRCRELREAPDVKNWLRAIVRHVCQNRRRYRWRNSLRWRPADAVEPDTLPDASGGAPEDEAARSEVRSLMLRAVYRLEPKAQQVFVLNVLMELSMSEIAELIQSSPNTVASRMRAARRELGRHLVRT
jgi:RNA polymerase sigma-70 factor (ECF subfamily)